MNFFKLLWLIPLLPALGALINGLFGKRLQAANRNLVHVVAVASTGLSLLVALGAIAQLMGTDWRAVPAADGKLSYFPEKQSVELNAGEWMVGGDIQTLGKGWDPETGKALNDDGMIGSFRAPWLFAMDHLTAIMLFLVTFVGFLIHIFAIGYMDTEPSYWRFFCYLNLFMASMLILVLGGNALLMFVGWEGVGLCSYLLIGFFFKENFAADAGKKAFLTNRIGDMGFVVGGMLLLGYFGTLNFRELGEMAMRHEALGIPAWVITVATLCMFVGATGKSAQLPLYVWLPDAMAGPTPVSALIHAATMVTSGIYMIARANGLFMNAPLTCMVVATVGVLTALVAASIALVQNDIKKVLAYSTVSQLGYMFLGTGVAAFGAGIFHVLTHGFFKALMFLGSGSIIHALHHEQDMRRMGNLRKYMPATFLTFLCGWWAIAGLPPFSGFFSKDEILWRTKSLFAYTGNAPAAIAQKWAATWPTWYPMFLWSIGAVAAGMTAFYMTRLMGLTFFNTERVDAHVKKHLHESSPVMTWPLAILAVGAALIGLLGMPGVMQHWGGVFESMGGFWERWFEPVLSYPLHLTHHQHAELAGAEWGGMGTSVLIALLGVTVAFFMYVKPSHAPERMARAFKGLYMQLLNKHWVDEFYKAVFIGPFMMICRWMASFDRGFVDGAVNGARDVTLTASHICYRAGDRLVIEWALVNGLFASGTRGLGALHRRFVSGQVQHYAMSFALGLALLVWFLVRWFVLPK